MRDNRSDAGVGPRPLIRQPVILVRGAPLTSQVAVVSCDIVGHSRERSPKAQRGQLQSINDLVSALLRSRPAGEIVWASRGDGGHVAIAAPDWPAVALRLVLDLRAWSASSGAPLRVIAHHGDVGLFTGADGRTELVGDTINLVGRLIHYAGPGRVVVSEAFVRAVGQPPEPGIRFHDPLTVHPKYFPAQVVHLLSWDGRWESAWGTADDDRSHLEAAQAEGAGWDVVYHAKRLLQVNSSDADAERALRDLEAMGLQFRNHVTGRSEVNPVLGRINGYTRAEFIRAAQLVERDDGDLLCRADDSGDTMFVILRGQVQVLPPGHPPSLRATGDIVGELAFALRRSRTAAMRCVGRTALLGFTYQHLSAQLLESPTGSLSKGELDKVLLSRILKYVCTTAPYLAVADPANPLHPSRRPWELLQYHTHRLPRLEDGTNLSFADDAFREDGLYVLVGGRLHGLHDQGAVLDGDDLPVVYASFPDRFVSVNKLYKVEGEATLVHIGVAGFKAMGAPSVKAVADAVKAESNRLLHYDVFLSYSSDDGETVTRWKRGLEAEGFQVFMDTANLIRRFPERLAAALLDSRVLVPLVSANTMRRRLEENWVRSEIDYRQACYDRTAANILPVRLIGGTVEPLADGFVSVDADGREAEALREVVEAVRGVRDGRTPPPFATRRRPDVKLRAPSRPAE